MNQMLDQIRFGFGQQISINQETINIIRKPTKDDGFGGNVENPYGTPSERQIKCRISKESRAPETYKNNTVGLSVIGSWFILVDYKTTIYQGDIFEARGLQWRIGAVSEIKIFGGVVGYEAPLIEAETI